MLIEKKTLLLFTFSAFLYFSNWLKYALKIIKFVLKHNFCIWWLNKPYSFLSTFWIEILSSKATNATTTFLYEKIGKTFKCSPLFSLWWERNSIVRIAHNKNVSEVNFRWVNYLLSNLLSLWKTAKNRLSRISSGNAESLTYDQLTRKEPKSKTVFIISKIKYSS